MKPEIAQLSYEMVRNNAIREALESVVDLEVAELTEQLISAARDGKQVEAAKIAGAIGSLRGFLGLLESAAKKYAPSRE